MQSNLWYILLILKIQFSTSEKSFILHRLQDYTWQSNCLPPMYSQKLLTGYYTLPEKLKPQYN
jgi:hypothetical protein